MTQKITCKSKLYQKALTDQFKKQSLKSKLIIIQDGTIADTSASDIYIHNKIKFADALPNVTVKHFYLKDQQAIQKFPFLLLDLLKQEELTQVSLGIMLQKPCDPMLEKRIMAILDQYPQYDVEGVCRKHVTDLVMHDQPIDLDTDLILPCTTYGNLLLLDQVTHGDHRFYDGKNVLIVGRSEIVGRPLSQILINENCTLTIANSHTTNLNQLTSQADVIISCVGHPDLIQTCKPGAVLIDNGCSFVNGKQHGDIKQALYDQASAYTPYTHATGPATIVSLFVNLLKLNLHQNRLINETLDIE